MRRYESQPAGEVPNMTLGDTKNGRMNASYEKADFDLFVGFRSPTLQISEKKTSGWLKKLVQEVKFIQESIFPRRYFNYCRETGTLQIYEKRDGALK